MWRYGQNKTRHPARLKPQQQQAAMDNSRCGRHLKLYNASPTLISRYLMQHGEFFQNKKTLLVLAGFDHRF
jgi:hypothetical protein